MATRKTVATLVLTGIILLAAAACSNSKDPAPTNTGEGGAALSGGEGGAPGKVPEKDPPSGW